MGMASQLQIVLFGLLLVFLCHPGSVTTYRPVVVLHGILASDTAMEEFVQYIQTAHPGTQVLNVDAYNDLFSVLPMWNQMKGVQAKIQSFVDGAPDGVHMICYSQDPYHQDLYYQHCDYLPLLNNGTNPAYKTNFLNLQQLVLIGGPDDGVITPWESSQFGFYEDNSETVADMKSQSFYTKDSFGLRTLDMQGKIARYTIPAPYANGYRPVVVLHGVLSSNDSMTDLVQFIQKAHPATDVLNVDAYNDAVSNRIPCFPETIM
eukprot:Em0013g1059a